MPSIGRAASADVPTYVDTSALLRLVERRGDYSLVEAAMRDSPTTSELADLECWASIHKRWHDGELNLAQRDELLQAVRREALAPVILLRIDSDTLNDARSVAARFPIRSLDAIHLATALVADRKLKPLRLQVRFCTADARQADAARGLFGASEVDLVPGWR
jgi:predicted nucleic acid-binding protein